MAGEFVILASEEYDVGWMYFFDSKRHQESADFRDSLGGNAPILVDRSDGSVHHTGTARTAAEYVQRYRDRDPNDERSWHP